MSDGSRSGESRSNVRRLCCRRSDPARERQTRNRKRDGQNPRTKVRSEQGLTHVVMVRREQMGDLVKLGSVSSFLQSALSDLTSSTSQFSKAKLKTKCRLGRTLTPCFSTSFCIPLALYGSTTAASFVDGSEIRYIQLSDRAGRRDPKESQRRQTHSRATDRNLTLNGSNLHGSEGGQGAEEQASERGEHGRLRGAARSDVSSFETNEQQRDRRVPQAHSLSGRALPSRHARLVADDASSQDVLGQVK